MNETEDHADYPCFICRRPESAHTDLELDTCLDAPLPIELTDEIERQDPWED